MRPHRDHRPRYRCSAMGHVSPGQKGRRFTSGRQRWFWATPAGDLADTMAAPAGAVRQPRRPATSSGRSCGRSQPPLAGPVQPSLGPARAELVPEPRSKSGLPGHARRSTCADDTRRWMPESTHCTETRPGCSSHEPSHGSHTGAAGSVTVSDGNCLGRTRAYPPFWRQGFSGAWRWLARRMEFLARYGSADGMRRGSLVAPFAGEEFGEQGRGVPVGDPGGGRRGDAQAREALL